MKAKGSGENIKGLKRKHLILLKTWRSGLKKRVDVIELLEDVGAEEEA